MSVPKDVKTYVADLPPGQRKRFQELRKAVKAAAPRTEECISYAIPALRYKGYGLVWYAAWKNHCSLYPLTGAVKKADLKGYLISKGTIRFPNDKPLPAALIRRLVKGRMKENEARAAKRAKK